jgi:outer membrane protein assembly factor BamB
VTVGRIGGVDQVIHPQGDGWVRGFDPLTGKKLWEFDSNPKDSVWPKTRNELISTAVVWEDRVYIANGHDPEQGEGVGHLYCIDATKRGDISESGRVWHYDKIRRSMSTAAVHDGLIYCADFSGFLHCLDARTGRPHWVHDMLAAVWASPVVADGKVYLGDEDGDVAVFQAGTTKKILAENNLGNSVYSSAVPANRVILLNSRNRIFALAETEP